MHRQSIATISFIKFKWWPFASTVEEPLSKNDDGSKEVMKDGENEKDEKEPTKSSNEVRKALI